jgi:hypothetical protein
MAIPTDAPHASFANADRESTSRIPTHYLGNSPQWRERQSRYSGALPRVSRPLLFENEDPNVSHQQSTLYRRRLLAIFGRMMARFYEHHKRRWSMGRWNCQICRHRIVSWGWVPDDNQIAIMHETCVNRSMWDIVIYYERLVRAGYAPEIPHLRFNFTP